MKLFLFALIVSAASLALAAHTEPAPTNEAAFKVHVSRAGVDYAKNEIAIPILQELRGRFMRENLADRLPAVARRYVLESDLILVGKVTWTTFSLDEIKLVAFDLNSERTGLTFGNRPDMLGVSLGGLNLRLTARGRIGDHVIAIEAGVSNLSASIGIKMGISQDFKPLITITEGVLPVTKENLIGKVTRGFGELGNKLVNAIVDWFKPKAVDMIRDMFNQYYRTPNAELAKITSSINLNTVVKPTDIPPFPAFLGDNFKIRKDIAARISLNSSPTVSPQGLGLFFDPHVYVADDTSRQCATQCRRRVTPNPTNSGGTFVEVQLTDSMLCCWVAVAQKLGMLNYRGSLDPLPAMELPADLAPGLEPLVSLILNRYSVSYAVTMLTLPVITLTPSGANVEAREVEAIVFVRDKSKPEGTPPVKAATVKASVSGAARASIQGLHLSYSVTRLNLRLIHFEAFLPELIEAIKTPMQNLVDVIVNHKVLPMINTLLSEGMDLPSVAGFTFANSRLTFAAGYARVSTAFTYRRPADFAIPQFIETGEQEQPEPINPILTPPTDRFPIVGERALGQHEEHPHVRLPAWNEGDYDSYIQIM